MTKIFLLRHGETESGQCFRGSLDDELTETGWQQMRQGVEACPIPDVILTSPLKRCARFAHSIAEKWKRRVEYVEGLKELDFGEWEGQTATQILQTHPDELTAFWRDPYSITPPGGESYALFESRIRQSWEERLSDARRSQLIVCHAGPIRMIRVLEYQLPVDQLMHYEVASGSLHQF